MIALAREDLKNLVAAARLAPSVHNVQPTRWRLAEGGIEVIGDPRRSIPVADPDWRDWRLSHGAAIEGLSIALGQKGLQIAKLDVPPSRPLNPTDAPQVVARATLASLDHPVPAEPTTTRTSWRGSFSPADEDAEASLDRLATACDDIILVRGAAVADVAVLGDRAGLHFLRDAAHRRELLDWLRLSGSHANYRRDGLNSEAMCLNTVEAWGAGLVLGRLFPALDRTGLASPLVSEHAKTRTAAAIMLLHRPKGEDAIESGGAFYRAWLEMERQGLKGCPMSVLADWPEARDKLSRQHRVPADRHIISVFRIGRPAGLPRTTHERLPVDELIV